MRLKDKVAIITGAATGLEGELMGYGGATARLFAREGAKVVIVDIKDDIGERTAAQMCEQGTEAMYIHLDVTKEDDWNQAVKKTVSKFGKLDILVNNAGVGAGNPDEDLTQNDWDWQFDVMAKGTFLGTKYAIREMLNAGSGSIVNVSSIFSIIGSRGDSIYSAAKGAIHSFTKSVAVMYADKGIRVNSVHPGWALTPLSVDAFSDPNILNPKLATVPMGRLAKVEEIGYGILYLASDEASFVTGAELVIDGGKVAS